MKYSAKRDILEYDDLGEVAWEAIEPIWDDLPYSSASKLDAFMAELTEGQRALIAIDWCQKEIRNGGIEQLFMNSTGNLVPYAIQGFRLIGAKVYADNLTKAAELLGGEYPKSGAARKRAFESMNEARLGELERLENEFLDVVNSAEHDIEKYRGSYVKNNPSQFMKT